MADSIWEGFIESISGEEKLLPLSWYEVEVLDARPMVKEGQVQRGIFLDLKVLKGPEKGQQVSVYVGVPEPGNKRQGFWYAKKMAGFGDLTAVYKSMPPDLEGGLQVLCAAITGRKILAQVGPGNDTYSDRNSLQETKEADNSAPVATEEATSEETVLGEEDPF